MAPEELANRLGISAKALRAWLRSRSPRPVGQKGTAWSLTPQQVTAAGDRFGCNDSQKTILPASSPPSAPTSSTGRARSDEAYVIDLCDEVMDEKGRRQYTFDWLVGDAGRNGACRCLPVDAYYEGRGLVIEYRERQHEEAVPFFDRRHTVSGVGRGEQRRIYDRRRASEIPKHGLRLLIITSTELDADRRGRLRRNSGHDLHVIKALLSV